MICPSETDGNNDDLQRSDSNLRELMMILSRRRWLVGLTMLLTCAVAAVVAFQLPLIYEAHTTIKVGRRNPQVVGLGELLTADVQASEYLNTQCRLAKSDTVLTAALEKPGIAELRTFADSDDEPLEVMKEVVEAEPIKRTQMFSIKCKSRFPEEAAAISNAVAEAYLDFNETDQNRTTNELLRVLTEQKAKFEAELTKKEQELIRFKEKHGALTFSSSDEGNVVIARLAELEKALTKAELERISLQSKLQALKQLAATKAAGYVVNIARPGSQVSNLSWLQSMLENQLLSERKRLLEMQPYLGPEHPMLLSAQQRIEANLKAMQQQQQEALQAELALLQMQYAQARQVEQQLRQLRDQQMALAIEQDRQKVRYESMLADVERTRQLYEVIASRIKELNIDYGVLNLRVVDVAKPPREAAYPNKALIICAAAIVGLLLGIGLAFTAERMDNSLRTAEEVSLYLQLPLLGFVPTIHRRSGEQTNAESDPQLQSHYAPRSPAAEAYRSIRTGIYFSGGKEKIRRILVTSPAPGDGKTTLATNLAITMAQSNRRTVIIDADFRKPRLGKTFGIDNERGLSNALIGEVRLEEIIYPTMVENLWVIPCGTPPPNPAELLNDDAFAQLLEKLAERFEKIIIDSPPVLAVTDASITAANVDGVLLVLRSAKNARAAAVKAKQQLLAVGARIIGAVLNDAGSESHEYSYYYYYERNKRRKNGGDRLTKKTDGEDATIESSLQ